ncbi:hypothetical protein CNMCM5793_000606 [Aspergillus hiratsukae]|uniref:Endo-1,3(4)-beta-glucanase n=1 Tax=Aspergillus hiratsukae TaxID=1194566 RepID=A0A8H6P9X2_9EURO|nr:hypothetical protein CNMCM5793_000606 [Aspergillus hiratsukae]KAF7169940.1 hypothetical protein CNMCM6106_004798 [Aspergillus hiratsukae]
MVLNDTSPQSGDFSPPSQNGNGSRTYTRGHLPIPGYPLVIKTESLSRPDFFTLYFGFFGQRNWIRKNAAHTLERIESCKVMINRIPTQDELDAFVETGSKYIYHQRLGAPYFGAIGAAWAYWRLSNSREVKHLAPGGVEPGKRPTPGQVFGALKLYASIEPANFRSLVVWGGVRWFFFVLTGSMVTSVWGMFHDLKAAMADPRLKQFFAEMREKDPEEVRRRKVQRVAERSKAAKEAAERRAQGLPPVEAGMGQGAGGGYTESHEHDQGGAAYGSLDPYSSSSARESVPSTSQDRAADVRRLFGDASTTESTRGATTADENKATDFFAGDDASPVAAEYQSGGGSQGSAWDRIRQQAGSRSGSGSQGGQDSGLGSAWNRPSMPDNERRERDQAQADFDRLLEAERNMGGGSEKGEKKGGWGRWN